LNLSDNLARQEAITVFANSLRVNTVLEVLDFSNTTVGEGSESLADGIKKSKGLKVLHLNNLKDMTTKGRKMLIQMLAADKLPLIYFSMNSVGLGEIEAKELVRALKFNTKLEELSVKGSVFF
jgi:Ran GTPase-activating protein (RanGAP) involved in mRNA processing and transport